MDYLTLDEIIAKYKPAYEDTWDAWWNCANHATSRLITELQEELEVKGYFDSPVILVEDEWDDGEFYPAIVGNGMHRLMAHYRSGIQEVHVRYGYPETVYDEDAPEYNLVAIFNEIITDEVFDELYELLSWRSQGGEWIEREFASMIDGKTEVWLYGGKWELVKDEPVFNTDASVIQDEIVSRVEGLGFNAAPVVKWVNVNEESEA